MGDLLKFQFTGADALIGKILAFKREKYGIFRRAGTKAGKALVASLRQTIQATVGNKGTNDQSALREYTRQLAPKAPKVGGRLTSPVKQTKKERSKEAEAWAKKLLKQTKKQKSFAQRVIERSSKSISATGVEKTKSWKAKKVKVPKAKEYTLNQIVKMISTDKEARLVKKLIQNRKLFGPGRLKKNGIVQEIGKTGGLAKSINFKVSMAKPKRMAFDRETGEMIGGAGVKPADNPRAWKNPKWKTVSANRVVMLVGATKMKRVVWNPFIKRLQMVNPKRYLHLVENGHVLKIRGRSRRNLPGKHPVKVTWLQQRARTLALIKSSLESELAAVLAKKSAGGAK